MLSVPELLPEYQTESSVGDEIHDKFEVISTQLLSFNEFDIEG